MAKQLAHDVGYIYIDSGAMYRAVALHCMRQGWITNDDMDVESIESHIHTVQLKFVLNDTGYAEIYLNGENVESAIRSLEVSMERAVSVHFLRCAKTWSGSNSRWVLKKVS